MPATLSAGVNSLILKLDTPYDTIRTFDVRDDLIKVKVWCSPTSGFTPSDSTLVFDALSLSITIPRLTDGSPVAAGTAYYVRYAFISDIDETVYTLSSQLAATPVAPSSQVVDISGFTSFVKTDATSFTPSTVTLTAVTTGIVSPTYSWTIVGATPVTGSAATITITPNLSNGTGVRVTLSVTSGGFGTPITKTITIPITYIPPTYTISTFGASFRRDVEGYIYPQAGITLDGAYAKFEIASVPTYIWRKDDVIIPGATSYQYTVPVSDYATSDTHKYTSTITGKDLGGNPVSIESSVVIPVVNDGPIGPQNPSFTISNYGAVFRRDLDGVVYPTAGISLETTIIAFKSTPVVTYQWQKDGVNISGATSDTYIVPVSDYVTDTTHKYTCTATGQTLRNTALSLSATVTLPRVDDGPVGPSNPTFTINNYGSIFRRDLDGVVYPQAGVSLETSAVGFKSTPVLTYQWKKDDVVISGATSSTYTVPASDYTSVSTHKYSCTVTGQNTLGSPAVVTASVTLPRVDDGPVGPAVPYFTISNYGAVFRRDLDGIVYPQAGVSLETTSGGFKSSPAITYQWKKDDVVISGATSNTYTVPASDYTSAATHNYSCTATGQNTLGVATVVTASVTLPRVDDGPQGPSTPLFTISNYGSVFRKGVDGVVYPAGGVSVETTATGFKSSPAPTYTWKKDDVLISGATSSTYTIPVTDYASSTTHKYTCTATGQNNIGQPHVLSASINIARIEDGRVGEDGAAGPRTATGYIYYNTAQAAAPTKPATPTGYNFITGLFTGLDAEWSANTNASNPVAGTKVWAVSYAVLEVAYQSLSPPSITLSDPFTYQNFTGLVTFSNMNSAFGSNVTTIDGAKITTGSISANKLDTNFIQVGSAANDINTGTTTISGGRITTSSISADKLTTSFIQVGGAAGDINGGVTTISGGKITAGSISTDKLSASFIQVGGAAGDINGGVTTISGGKITANSISADKLTTSFLQVGSAAGDINGGVTTINGGKITAGSITTDRLATSFLQVGSAAGDINTGVTTISGGKITAGSITADRLQTQFLQVGSAAGDINGGTTTISGGKITAGSITADRLQTQFLQVGSAAGDINNGVTTISGGKITAGSITADRLQTQFLQVGNAANDINGNTTTINGGKITAGSVTADRLATQFLQVGSAAGDINNGVTTISGGKITAGSIAANKLSVSFIQVGSAASDINSGSTTINGGKITTGTLDARSISTQYAFIGQRLQSTDGYFVIDFANKFISISV
jgi:hypothetical protein